MKKKIIVSNIKILENDWLQVKVEREAKSSIWDLPKMAKSIKMKPLGLSREDEEIYAV